MGALTVGLGSVALAMTLFHIKINFFNFVALPVSFGIGVDYAVNFVLRYDQDPSQGALGVLRSTGGAILLCSMTTMLGYTALLGSVNQAIRSLGLLAVLGEIGCLAAAAWCYPDTSSGASKPQRAVRRCQATSLSRRAGGVKIRRWFSGATALLVCGRALGRAQRVATPSTSSRRKPFGIAAGSLWRLRALRSVDARGPARRCASRLHLLHARAVPLRCRSLRHFARRSPGLPYQHALP